MLRKSDAAKLRVTTFGGRAGNDTDRADTIGSIRPERGETAGERVQAGTVVPEQGVQSAVSLPEIGFHSDGIKQY